MAGTKNGQSDIGLRGKKILLVNTGSIKKRLILQQLKKLGLIVIVLHKEKNWAQPYIDHWILADTTNHKESLQAVRDFFKQNPEITIDGALTFWEDDVLLTSRITDAFNLIGIPFSVAQHARNKYLFREFCEHHGIRSPQHKLIKSIEDCKYVSEQFSFPLVIKPVYGASSAYVVKVNTDEELLNTYEYIKKNISLEIESALTNGFDILAEEYIDGEEVDIDILLQNGKIKFYSITDNFQTREPFFVETGDAIPSGLPVQDQERLIELAEEVLEKLGVQNGCIHFEAKSTRRGPVPIEVNLRMGGDQVYSYVKGAWNVDLIDNAVKIACGIYIKHIPKPERPFKYLAGQYFLSDDSGILVKLDIDENLRKDRHLEDITFYKKIGDPVLVPPEGYEFLGWVTVSGDNLIDAQENLRTISKYVNYEVAKFNRSSFIGRTLRKNRFSAASLNKDMLLRAAKKENIKRVSIEDVRSLPIGIGYNTFEGDHDSAEQDVRSTAHAIEQELRDRGYTITMIDFNSLPEAFENLRVSDVGLLLNMQARVLNSQYPQENAAALLDMLDIPFAGSDPITLGVCADLIRVKKLLTYHGIPSPRWDYVYTLDDDIRDDLRYPLIVKPAYRDHLRRIAKTSVVTNRDELLSEVRRVLIDLSMPALIEEFIAGDEYHALILGNDNHVHALPLARTIFTDVPEGGWPLYTSDALWQHGEQNEHLFVQRPPKNISKKLESLITEISLDSYNIMECKDYARVKIRVDKDLNPYIICIDPVPPLGSGDCLSSAASLVGMNHGDLIEEIIRIAIQRYKSE